VKVDKAETPIRRDLNSVRYFNDILRGAFVEDAFLYKRLQEVGVYYNGEEGLPMNKYGPVVKLGPKPYPLTPCAHPFYANEIEAKGEKYYLLEGVKLHELRVYSAAMGVLNESVKCFLLTFGFVVRLDEYYLLKTRISQYCKSLLGLMAAQSSVRSRSLKKMKIVSSRRRDIADIGIRSLWPGNTHRVFAKPALAASVMTYDEQEQKCDSNKKESHDIIQFHSIRLEVMKSYLQKVWREVTHDIVTESGGTVNANVVPSYDQFASKKFVEKRFKNELDAKHNAVAMDVGASKMWFKQWYKRNSIKRRRK
jgi:hypothetical protein